MDGRTMPPSPSTCCILVRWCEASRLQRQLLARAYQQVCPEIRRSLQDCKARSDRHPTSDDGQVLQQPPVRRREHERVAM